MRLRVLIMGTFALLAHSLLPLPICRAKAPTVGAAAPSMGTVAPTGSAGAPAPALDPKIAQAVAAAANKRAQEKVTEAEEAQQKAEARAAAAKKAATDSQNVAKDYAATAEKARATNDVLARAVLLLKRKLAAAKKKKDREAKKKINDQLPGLEEQAKKANADYEDAHIKDVAATSLVRQRAIAAEARADDLTMAKAEYAAAQCIAKRRAAAAKQQPTAKNSAVKPACQPKSVQQFPPTHGALDIRVPSEALPPPRLDAAAQQLQRLTAALDAEPCNAAWYVARGFIFLDAEAWAAAEQDFREALRWQPNNVPAMVGRAQALEGESRGVCDLEKNKELREALHWYNHAIAAAEDLRRSGLFICSLEPCTLHGWMYRAYRQRGCVRMRYGQYDDGDSLSIFSARRINFEYASEDFAQASRLAQTPWETQAALGLLQQAQREAISMANCHNAEEDCDDAAEECDS